MTITLFAVPKLCYVCLIMSYMYLISVWLILGLSYEKSDEKYFLCSKCKIHSTVSVFGKRASLI